MKKLNCWEINHCGREPGGHKVKDLGICPTTVDKSSDGINSGKNGGRICWAIAGTFCRGSIQGYLALETVSCMICDFYEIVRSEEDSETFHLMNTRHSSNTSHK